MQLGLVAFVLKSNVGSSSDKTGTAFAVDRQGVGFGEEFVFELHFPHVIAFQSGNADLQVRVIIVFAGSYHFFAAWDAALKHCRGGDHVKNFITRSRDGIVGGEFHDSVL